MNTDDAIDRVLAGLAHVEPPPALEGRVLETIEHRATNRQTATSPWVLFHPWAIATGVVVLAIAGPMAVRKRHEPRPEEAVVKQHTSLAPEITTQPNARVQGASLPITPRKAMTAKPVALDDMEALAIEEMNAPSKPAPPLPLTHQEQLLAEAAHPDSAVERSSLRPEIRAQQMELSKAEFHDFFDPPPAKDNE